jgi:hypothetical protein
MSVEALERKVRLSIMVAKHQVDTEFKKIKRLSKKRVESTIDARNAAATKAISDELFSLWKEWCAKTQENP